jgi:hypothetical protein
MRILRYDQLEWLVFTLHRDTGIYAIAEKFALRARAARKIKVRVGLFQHFRRYLHEGQLRHSVMVFGQHRDVKVKIM